MFFPPSSCSRFLIPFRTWVNPSPSGWGSQRRIGRRGSHALQHGIELAAASLDLHGLIKSAGGIEPILRGAAYSRTQNVDASFVSEISVSSPLFNLAVEAVQRGRDHGETNYRASFQWTRRRCFWSKQWLSRVLLTVNWMSMVFLPELTRCGVVRGLEFISPVGGCCPGPCRLTHQARCRWVGYP